MGRVAVQRNREQTTKKSDMKKRDKAWGDFYDAFRSLLGHMDMLTEIQDYMLSNDDLNQITGRIEKLDKTIVSIADRACYTEMGDNEEEY